MHDDLSLAALDDGGEFFAPLHQDDAVGSDQLVEAEGIELTLGIDAVEIEVIEHDRFAVELSLVLVDEGEGGAGDLIGIGGIEGLGDTLDERGLACAEIAVKDKEFRRGEQPSDLMARRMVSAALLVSYS